MALRVLRLLAVASILAFGLTARAVTATHANVGDSAVDPPPAVIDPPPPNLDDPPPTEPAPTDAPTIDPPLPPDPPLPELPPVVVEAPPADPGGAAQTEAAPTDEVASVPTASTVPEPSPTIGDPTVTDASTVEPLPPAIPSDLPLPESVPESVPEALPLLAEDPAPTAAAFTPAIRRAVVIAAPQPVVAASAPAAAAADQPAQAPAAVPLARTAATLRLVEPGWVPQASALALLEELQPVSAGLVAGLAVTNRAPASVAVAIEFGRAGGGWAGAIVFNLWLRRQLRERRMSQRQLAALSGVDHSTISRLLMQDRRPTLATATKLARALKHVEGESDTADYFERIPEETIFPGRRVEMALRADELLDDAEVMHLMRIYLETRQRRQAMGPSAATRAARDTG